MPKIQFTESLPATITQVIVENEFQETHVYTIYAAPSDQPRLISNPGQPMSPALGRMILDRYEAQQRKKGKG